MAISRHLYAHQIENRPMLRKTQTQLRQAGSESVNRCRAVLLKHRKKATALTMNSLRYETYITPNRIGYRIHGDLSIQYINDGRPPGAKMPPSIFSRKGHRLNLWFGARGIPRNKSTDFLIRRAIAKNGIKPTPVLKEMSAAIRPLKNDIINAAKEDIRAAIYDAIKSALR